MALYKLEDHVNDWVKAKLEALNLKNQKDYHTESAIPDYLKEALQGRAKTEKKTNFGKPDFSITKYKQAPIVIENKLGLKNSSKRQKMVSNLMKNLLVIMLLMELYTMLQV